MVGYALDELINQGKAIAGSKVDLARSPIGIVVKAGSPKPDISTVEAFKKAMLAAKSVAFSDSASGVYVGHELFERLGIAEAMKDKAKMIPAIPVAEIVARGEAEIGFQQVSELAPVVGVDFVAVLPAEIQKITVFAAGIASSAKQPEMAAALIKYLLAPEAAPALMKTGLDPVAK